MGGIVERGKGKGEEKGETYRLIKTSPGPGSGISSSSIFVEIVPGLSYTMALYFFGMASEDAILPV